MSNLLNQNLKFEFIKLKIPPNMRDSISTVRNRNYKRPLLPSDFSVKNDLSSLYFQEVYVFPVLM